MAVYTGSVFINNKYFELNKKIDTYTTFNFPNLFSGSLVSTDFNTIITSSIFSSYNGLQSTNLEDGTPFNEISTTSSLGQIVYYQRIFSSGLNDWSYYKTVGSVNTNPASNITVPQYSGSILYHEIIGKLEL